MHCRVAVAFVSALFLGAGMGCGKSAASPALTPAPQATKDPVVLHREADEQAAFSIDAACASIEQARDGTKKLAPIAGGDAKEALLTVAEMFDSAGATLADHNQPPPPIETYRKEEGERSTERQKAVTDALDALQEMRDARGTLEDLSENVPKEHAQPLDAIQTQADEAISAIEDAIKRLGGKVPPEEEGS